MNEKIRDGLIRKTKDELICRCREYQNRKKASARTEITALLRTLRELDKNNPLCFINIPEPDVFETRKETAAMDEGYQMDIFDLMHSIKQK